jgi:Uma2 family endonuclease
MSRLTTALPGTAIDPLYADSDGRFMGDTEYHNTAMILTREALEDHFAQDEVYVASNLIVYFKKGDPLARRDPDVLVAKGVKGKHKRRSFRVWEEKKLPQVLFEIASKKTWRADIGDKRALYAKIGIKEYFVFDPENRYLDRPLQGFRSVKGQSVPIPWSRHGLVSKQLGLILRVEGDMLRFIDRKTGKRILTRREQVERAQLRVDLEKERADLQKARADAEKQRAESVERRAAELEAEIEKLKARVAKFGS